MLYRAKLAGRHKVRQNDGMVYRIIFIKSDEGFAVACPALRGCWSQGYTPEEATENIVDAILELLDVGIMPDIDGGALTEAEILCEAAEDGASVEIRDVQFPVPV